jgi:hypothetical protein
MAKTLKRNEILEHLEMLADWIRVKHPGDHFELVVVGGAAMALEGFKDQTMDIDIIRPEVLPEPIVNGVAHIGRIRRLSSKWLNSDVANMLLKTKRSVVLPEYFGEISRTIEVGKNLKISLIGRQALLSLKLYAATPSYRKHTDDIKRLGPNFSEITEAIRFVLSFDRTNVRKDDLRVVLKDLGFDFDDIYHKIESGDKQAR